MRKPRRNGVFWVLFVLPVIFLCGCGGEEQVFEKYKHRENGLVATNKKGVFYKVDNSYRLQHSDDQGKTWTTLGTIPAYGYDAWGYSLACNDESCLYFAQVGTGKGKKAVYVSKSLDRGETWMNPVIANDDILAQRRNPRIASKGEHVFVAWHEEGRRRVAGNGRPSGVYFTSSSDGGKNWSEDTWIREAEDMSISVGDDGVIYLTYLGGKEQNTIYISYSKDKGGTWRSEVPGEYRMVIEDPYVLCAGEDLYLFFQAALPSFVKTVVQDKIHFKTYYMRSTDRGKSWSKMKELE